jgi:hypothetical protein
MTMRQVLNRLVDRRRGVGWCLRVDDIEGVVTIHIFTHAPTDVDNDVGVLLLPANAEQITLEGAKWLDEEMQVRKLQDVRYERIEVYGERIRTEFSLALNQDSTPERTERGELRRGWSDDAETAYKDACKDAADPDGTAYADWGEDQQIIRNDEHRQLDKYNRVYTSFTVPEGWQGQCGINGLDNCLPIPRHTEGDIFEPSWGIQNHDYIWTYGKQFLQTLLTAETVEDISIRGRAEYIPPQAWMASSLLGYGRLYPGDVRLVPGELAVELTVNPGPRHRMARYHWPDVGGSNPEPSAFYPGSSWEDPATGETASTDGENTWDPLFGWNYAELVFTLALETDRRIMVEHFVVPSSFPSPEQPDVSRVLKVFVEGAHYWWRAPNTITGLGDNGVLTLSEEGTTLRDDSQILRNVLAVARAWYDPIGRATVRITRKTISDMPRPGVMVQNVFTATDVVNAQTVVTRRSWDFQQDTTSIETAYQELDVKAVAGVR